MTDMLYVQVYDFDHKVFEGDVRAISSVNDVGPYDILPDHAHFISLLQEELTLHHTSGKLQTLKITNGVVRCLDNNVQVYVTTPNSVRSVDTNKPGSETDEPAQKTEQ